MLLGFIDRGVNQYFKEPMAIFARAEDARTQR
jgi:hypothetical protein